MLAELHVELVAADHEIWSGEANIVIAKTRTGEIGIQAGHTPVLGELVSGPVTIRGTDGTEAVAAVHSGFLSFAENKLSVLAEVAELSEEIDTQRAERALEKARAAHDESAERRAELRLRAGMGRR